MDDHSDSEPTLPATPKAKAAVEASNGFKMTAVLTIKDKDGNVTHSEEITFVPPEEEATDGSPE